ncbi:MAG: cysteine desulfurase [Lachnospiraceae bacterium]|nr:cysteine desulfurase [Lachnospiraceae bacterium]
MAVYMDYNASAPIDIRVLEYMNEIYLNSYGNSDSRTHNYGDNARKIVEEARQSVASMIGRKKDEVFFTSGSTESNNIAILGFKEYAEKTGKKHIITSSIEHKAILEAVKYLSTQGFEVDFVKPEKNGYVNTDDVISLVRDETLLVSIMHVNNETGVIQPVKEIGKFLDDKDVLFHIDATQSAGKLIDEIKELKYDMMSFCAHKMYGPQGVGALILKKKRYKLPPIHAITYGGQQEHGIRPGTLPVALIAGFGKACDLAMKEYVDNDEKCKEIRGILISQLEKSKLEFIINGDEKHKLSNTLNVSICGVSSEALMLSTKMYCAISNGSACNTNVYSNSYVLQEMGLDESVIESAIRISWGPHISIEEISDNFCELLSIAGNFV